MSTERPTPADLRELTAAADALAERTDAVQAALRAEHPGARARAGFRLHEAAGDVRRASRALEDTAGELARIAATPEHACGIEWGVCPEHGSSLTRDSGRITCTAAGCTNSWGYDRVSTPCPEPVTHRITDTTGETQDVCDSHAIGARHRITASPSSRSPDSSPPASQLFAGDQKAFAPLGDHPLPALRTCGGGGDDTPGAG